MKVVRLPPSTSSILGHPKRSDLSSLVQSDLSLQLFEQLEMAIGLLASDREPDVCAWRLHQEATHQRSQMLSMTRKIDRPALQLH